MRLLALAAALLALLAAAPAAGAAVLDWSNGRALYIGVEQEANDVTVVTPPDGMRIRDEGAVIHPLPPCRAIDAHEVVCPPTTEVTIRTDFGDDRVRTDRGSVDLGAGDDVAVTGSVIGSGVDGGPGNDDITGPSLRGGDGNDRLTSVRHPSSLFAMVDGGAGDDVIVGYEGPDGITPGPGRDVVRAGAGDDTVADGGDLGQPAERDDYDGGAGTDVVVYGRSHPVRIDLAEGLGDADRDRDALAGFEDAVGGSGDDVLAGTDGANRLDGAGGDDLYVGRGGNDVLRDPYGDDRMLGGEGDDALRGGPGDDVLDSGPGDDALVGEDGRDALFGGDGRDTLMGGLSADVLDAGGGDDVLATARDRYRDRAACGDGTDAVDADDPDRLDGCERVLRRPLAPLLATRSVRVAGRTATLRLRCERPDVVLRVSVRRGRGVVARGVLHCPGMDHDGEFRPGVRPLRVRLAGGAVRRARRVTVVATVDDSLPSREPAVLRPARRG